MQYFFSFLFIKESWKIISLQKNIKNQNRF